MNSIPILMFHGVSDHPETYHKPELVCSADLFESWLKKIKSAGYTSISLDELHRIKKEGQKIKGRKCIITFDDGFLDNFVYAAPLLEKYGFTGELFVSTDFVIDSKEVRPTLKDVWDGKVQREQLAYFNYCTTEELRILDQTGVIRIQAHSASHSWKFQSDKLIGVYQQKEYQKWLEWENDPRYKPFQMTDESRKIPKGYPVFDFAPSLAVDKAYLPDSKLLDEFVNSYNTAEKPVKEDCINKAKELLEQYPGRWESEDEANSRLEFELSESKDKLENWLSRPVRHMAWPNGKFSERSKKRAAEIYDSFQVPGDRNQNTVDDDAQYFYRIGAPEGGSSKKDIDLKVMKLFWKMEFSRKTLMASIIYPLLIILEKLHVIGYKKSSKPKTHKYGFHQLASS